MPVSLLEGVHNLQEGTGFFFGQDQLWHGLTPVAFSEKCPKKARDRLIRLAETHPGWVLGYQDETWWSRLAQPNLHAWAAAEPLRLRELETTRDDPDRKALCC
jgi:hypothetical protein